MRFQLIRIITVSYFILFSKVAQSEGLSMLQSLSSLQWKNRIIVLNEVEDQVEVLRLLEKKQGEIKERDILWFVLDGYDVLSNYPGEMSSEFASRLRDQYQLNQDQVILIGKDGGLKSSFDGINLNAIFADIDAMPMRRQEMKN